MPRLLIAGRIHKAGLDLARSAPGVTVDYVETPGSGFLPLLPHADALVLRTQPLTAAAIAAAPRLRVVSRHGVGYDAVDVAALEARGIPLLVVGDVNAQSVAEHAMALILATARQLVAADAQVKSGRWDARDSYGGFEIAGRRLLILGFGRAGRRLAGIASAFGMQVSAHDPFLPETAWTGAPAARADALEPALAEADFVSIHAPRSGVPLLDAARIAAMKPGSILVNTARGGMIDARALREALDSGHIAAAALDVFDAEPPDADDPLARHPKVIATPHVAGLSREAMQRMAVAAVRNALDALDGRADPTLIVNRVPPPLRSAAR